MRLAREWHSYSDCVTPILNGVDAALALHAGAAANWMKKVRQKNYGAPLKRAGAAGKPLC